jgi:hypothetical protein
MRAIRAKAKLTRTIEASEVAANCDAVLQEIRRSGKGFLVAKNGRPHVELLPHRSLKSGLRKVRTQGAAGRRRPPIYRNSNAI